MLSKTNRARDLFLITFCRCDIRTLIYGANVHYLKGNTQLARIYYNNVVIRTRCECLLLVGNSHLVANLDYTIHIRTWCECVHVYCTFAPGASVLIPRQGSEIRTLGANVPPVEIPAELDLN